MFKRAGKWMVLALAGLLVIGLVGFGAVYAQGPKPQGTPQANCPFLQGGRGWRWGGAMPQTLSEALGMTPEALAEAVKGGQKIADLAKAKGLTIAQLVDKLIAPRQTALAEAVKSGRITQEQADTMLKQMHEQMAKNIENGTCTPLQGGTGCARLGGQGGCGGAQNQAQPGRAGMGIRRGMGRSA